MQNFNIRNSINLHRGKALIVACLLAMPLVSQAQLNYLEYVNKKLYFGIMLGFNSTSFKITQSQEFTYDDTIQKINAGRGPGFNLGIISNYRLGKYFDLRLIPTLSFGGKDLNYTLYDSSFAKKSIENISIEFPVEVRFKSQPIKDIRLYVLTGLKYSIDLASNAKSRRADDQVKVSRHDLAYELGLGIQFFFPLFIFSPEVKVANGFVNLHSRNDLLNYSRVIDKLFSRGIIFSLHFEG
ncbi:MAG: outer membrane beta-barrel protein [Chitinophagales bacterium]|nr:outer membrane beta-barrel protein [Chitinophagales bacterium]